MIHTPPLFDQIRNKALFTGSILSAPKMQPNGTLPRSMVSWYTIQGTDPKQLAHGASVSVVTPDETFEAGQQRVLTKREFLAIGREWYARTGEKACT
mmetsp:Transcript_19621/g.39791  ORF Transcript_19621/g.39791 Transcript_19621/m.39791 type:complete len:97 (+) Transcript_19621:241-531(+)